MSRGALHTHAFTYNLQDHRGQDMNAEWLQEFSNPPSVYRGKPFWAWNGKLEPDELRRQIRLLKHMGLGGFFMHSRVGLDTEYLSYDWFQCVAACIDEAKKQKMEAWLYDEDRWPSGAAGGLVTKDPRYRMRHLQIDVYRKAADFEWGEHTLAVFTAKLTGHPASNVRSVNKHETPELASGESLIRFRRAIQDESDWYNGQAYLDTMNPEAVKRFIEVTHETYRDRCGKDFGGVIPGIFTDEPNHGPYFLSQGNRLQIPYTDSLPDVFRRRYGYDVTDRLLEVVFDIQGQRYSQVRYHYHECTTFMFVDAFARLFGEWCEKHNLPHTGHVLFEETPDKQTRVDGSAMRYYEYMQAPGMDLLTEHNREYDTAKQVSSVARQFGRKWRLTETYGCTGWDFPFMGHKALGDWQAALGINLRCQHLSWYTMQGEAKRDYPAGIFYQSPWWDAYPKVEDYFGRIGAIMTRGVEIRDVLVVHPIESMWLLFHKDFNRDPRVEQVNRSVVELRDTLLGAHLDFDYGEEDIMARHASVDGDELVVGQARYQAVVVPPMLTIRKSTLELLAEFQKAGGLVVFAGEVSDYVDALESDAAKALAAACVRAPAKGPKLAAALESTRRISIADTKGKEIVPALYLLSEDDDNCYLFVCNTSLSEAQRKPSVNGEPAVRERKEAFGEVIIRGFGDCAGSPLDLDPESGAVYTANAKRLKTGWAIHTSLPALGSRLFVMPKRKTRGKRPPARKTLKAVRRQTLNAKKWPAVYSEANNLVLDRPKYRIGNGKWAGPEEILRIDNKVRETLGLRPRGGQMVQPWARDKVTDPRSVAVTLSYRFQADALPTGDLYLAIEEPGRFKASVNGVPLCTDAESGWWTDRSLRKIPVPTNAVRLGANEVLLECDYLETFSGLEIVYLLGHFGTKVKGTQLTMTKLPADLKLGDWVPQGLAFYSGSVAYQKTIKSKLKKGQRLFVQIPEYRGVAVRVIVNGRNAGVVAWEPNEIDITACLDGESNDLRIEVLGHRRNSHGPHHLKERWPRWTGPSEYKAPRDRWLDGYCLVPCGLMAAPKLVVKG